MPLLDVSFVLDNPMFRRDDITVRRNTLTVNDFGEGVPSIQEITISGVVIPNTGAVGSGGGSALMRSAEGERAAAGFTFVTKFPLQLGTTADGTVTDIVSFDGVDHTVYNVNPYSEYGEGYYLAILLQTSLNPAQ